MSYSQQEHCFYSSVSLHFLLLKDYSKLGFLKFVIHFGMSDEYMPYSCFQWWVWLICLCHRKCKCKAKSQTNLCLGNCIKTLLSSAHAETLQELWPTALQSLVFHFWFCISNQPAISCLKHACGIIGAGEGDRPAQRELEKVGQGWERRILE